MPSADKTSNPRFRLRVSWLGVPGQMKLHETRMRAAMIKGSFLTSIRLIATLLFLLIVANRSALAFDDAQYPDLKGQWARVPVPGGQPAFDPKPLPSMRSFQEVAPFQRVNHRSLPGFWLNYPSAGAPLMPVF